MIRALLYLRLTSLKNLLRTHASRLRQPKYLAGFLFGAAYFYFFFFRPMHAGRSQFVNGGVFGGVPAEFAPLLLGFGSLALLLVVAAIWVLAADKPALHFSEAEIAFLFPAPVSQRTLVHYKLLSTLFTSLLQTVFFALIFNGRSLLSSRALPVIAGWWIVLSFVSLHFIGASLATTRLAERGWSAGRRRALLLAVGGTLLAALLFLIWKTQPDILLAPSVPEWLRATLDSVPLSWLLWPFSLLVAPFFAEGLGGFALALLPALLLLALEYAWIARTKVGFEEASVAHAAHRSASIAEAVRTGKRVVGASRTKSRRPPFNLALARWPELAFLWKNLLSSHAWITPRVWLIAAGLIVASSVALQKTLGTSYWMAGGALAALGSIIAGMSLLYGPLLTRMDLRQDIANADILKTYPLAGWRIVLGELLAPVLVISALIWLGLLAWVLGLHGHQPPSLSLEWFGPAMRVVFALCCAAIAPFLVALELLVPNAAPVLLPGWFRAIRTPGAGIDLMGQRLIFGFGQIIVILLALLPAVVTAGVLVFITQWFAGPALAVVFATAAVILVLAAELWCGVWWVGGRFEKLDLAEARA
jgi:hypothetical protein